MPPLGFGLERIGFMVLRAPIIAACVVVALTAVAAIGIPRLQADDALSELFRSDTPEFKNYEEMSRRFPVSEFDVLIILSSKKLLTPENLERIRFLHLEIEFAEAVSGVLSLFSMRDKPDETGFPPPLIPEELPEGAAFDALMDRVGQHPLINGKFLFVEPDGSGLSVLVLSLDQRIMFKKGLGPSLGEIEQLTKEVLKDTQLEVSFAGAPFSQLEIREAIRHDRIIYNGAGLLVGALIALLFFRRLSLVFITALCPLLAIIWALGLLGFVGQKLNTFINVIPPLVMVIAFADSMHMVFAVRSQLRKGADRFEAARHALKTVGPACVLTSLTTSLAMLSLTLTDSGLIRSFGFAAAMATLLAFVAVITVVPLGAVLLLRNEEQFRAGEQKRGHAIQWLQDGCKAIADWLSVNFWGAAIISIAAMITLAAFHYQLEPQYRLSDEVPRKNTSITSSRQLDGRLTGAHPLHIMVRWPEGKSIADQDVVDAISKVHALHESHPAVGNVWSVDTLRRWLREIGKDTPETLADYMSKLPEHLLIRFLNKEERSALITGRLPNLTSSQSVPIMYELEQSLEAIRTLYPGFEFTVTGLTAVSALQSANMIRQLNNGLLWAVVIVIIFVGIAFRSVRISLLSFVPNIFPIVAAGGLLFIMGDSLGYASVIALTVGFGLAVDDTIHFLSRLEIERRRLGSLAAGVHETITRIGTVLVLTTLILVAGMAVTMASDLPSMRIFGQIVMTTLIAALIGDIIILPAIVLALNSLRKVK